MSIKSIAVITPGGDAPGMNTAIRAVVRTALYHRLRVYGIKKGWFGLMNGLIEEMNHHSVSGIINQGGTILHTSRCPEFREKKNQQKGYQNLAARSIDSLVVIGGDGSMRASYELIKSFSVPINVIPATIDNDIPGTDFTIGFDTAVNTALEAIDKIRDTATSHDRLFIVEVMGREKGFIALDVGLASGAEGVIIPEVKFDLNKLVKKITDGQRKGKSSYIIVVAEGAAKAGELAEQLRRRIKNIDVRVSILGHVQRGGVPTALSRELACKMGAEAVELLIRGKSGYLVGVISDRVHPTLIRQILKRGKAVNLNQLKLAEMLAT